MKKPPAGWKSAGTPYGIPAYRHGKLTVVVSTVQAADGASIQHVSVSHPDHIPSHAEVQLVKDAFIGTGRNVHQHPGLGITNIVHLYCDMQEAL